MQHALRPHADAEVEVVKLAPREAEVLRLVAEGRPNKDIAYLLAIAEGTVAQYVSSLFADLQVSSRLELCLWAMQHPEAFRGEWVHRDLHLPGCDCGSVYCTAMRFASPSL